MLIGTRLVYPDEVGLWDAELMQISVYRNMEKNLNIMMDSVQACRDAEIRFVIHPVGYSLLDDDALRTLAIMAEWSDNALILHDERAPDGSRLTGDYGDRFRKALKELGAITRISLENAIDTVDVQWFWNNFADSVTIDIGHIEAAGLNSVEFIKELSEDTIDKVQYVHLHRNNGIHGGITDHWPLNCGCRELRSLEELIKRKSDLNVILELNETNEIGESLRILRKLRDRLHV